jgi:alkanesulfonate monooxygenase SsuD/methylene tetrahydromethanopterin reductase-like flavin-dependent oxidoreductase (luciferase family)
MPIRLGYLLPTREHVMAGRSEASSLLALASRAESLGYDSVWVGDSLLARPRHDPITMLAAVAARLPKIELGTAVLLPALRNPVLLAQQLATLDQIAEGRLILGVGIASDVANIRAEFAAAGVAFEKRVGRMLEALRLCRALWSGKAVDWDGRWRLDGGVLLPIPHRPGGPPIWVAGAQPASLRRVGELFDGWLPNSPNPAEWARHWQEVGRIAAAAGRDPGALVGAMYLTLAVDVDARRAALRLDRYLEQYYGRPAAEMRARQACYAGAPAGLQDWLSAYVAAGARHLVLRFAGDHERQLEALAAMRSELAAAAPV